MNSRQVGRVVGSGLVLAAVLFSGCASMNKPDRPASAAGTDAPAPATGVYVWSKSMEAKRVALDGATGGSGISVLRTKDNQLQINVPSDFSFDIGSAAIKPTMRPVLDQLAQGLETATLSHMLILVVGHTDDRGSDAVNDALSLARAENVRKYLETKGIASARVTVEGHGEHEPMVGNDMGYTRALNRRVEIYLREPQV